MIAPPAWPPPECEEMARQEMMDLFRTGSTDGRLAKFCAAAMAATLERMVEWCDARADAANRDFAAFPESAAHHQALAIAYESCAERLRAEARRYRKPEAT